MHKSIIAKLTATLLCLTVVLIMAYGVLAVEADTVGSLTITYHNVDLEPIPGSTFQIYRVGQWDGESYHLVGDFVSYPVLLDAENNEDWAVIASTLAGYAARDAVQPLAQGTTDDAGNLTFAGLETGMYLVTGDPTTVGNVTYTPQAFLSMIPGRDAEGELLYDVTVVPKYDYVEAETIQRKVLKIWEDEGSAAARPESITVQLLRDGEVYDEQVLSAANNWRYTWDGLAAAHDWAVVEKEVPEGYTVTVGLDGITFVVTNTHPEEPSEPTTPEPSLPQTGQLWWPVVVLLAAGCILIVTGLICRKKYAQ